MSKLGEPGPRPRAAKTTLVRTEYELPDGRYLLAYQAAKLNPGNAVAEPKSAPVRPVNQKLG
jgi:hypothetical protein